MSKRSDKKLLQDIKEAGALIKEYIGKMNYPKFLSDKKTQDAVIRNLGIIGEAVKNISAGLKKENRDIPWKNIAGMRDRLIHDYSGVNIDIVWRVVENELQAFIRQTNLILKNLK